MSSFGDYLKNLREAQGLSIRAASRLLNKTGTTYVDGIERGKINPRPDSLEQLAAVYKIELDKLLIASGRIPDKYKKYVIRNIIRFTNFLEKLTKK